MKLIRYLIFVVFDWAYRDGTRPENADPHFATLFFLMFYTGLIFEAALFYIDEYLVNGLIDYMSKPVDGIIYGFGMLISIIIDPPIYYYFIRKKKFDAFYQEFRYAAINTKKNRKLAFMGWILLSIILIALLSFVIALHTK